MKNFIKIFVIVVIVSFLMIAPTKLQAQTKQEVLTNAKIIELARLGLGDGIIVEKIRQSQCQCDTSTNGLAQLKAAKVSDAIIMAMLDSSSGSFSESPSPKSSKNENLPVTPTDSKGILSQQLEPGIYLLEDGKMNAIEPTVFSGTKSSFLGSAMTYGIKKTKIRAVVRGKSANLQVKSARPEFYFIFSREYKNSGAVMAGSFYGYAATSPAEFMMVAMNIKENSREAILGEASVFGASSGAPDKYIREYSFEKIEPGVYKVVPKADLAPGEYCFYYAAGTLGLAGGKIF